MEKEELINIISYSVQHHEIAPGFFDYLYEEVKDSIILTEIIKEKFDFILPAFPNNSFFHWFWKNYHAMMICILILLRIFLSY